MLQHSECVVCVLQQAPVQGAKGVVCVLQQAPVQGAKGVVCVLQQVPVQGSYMDVIQTCVNDKCLALSDSVGNPYWRRRLFLAACCLLLALLATCYLLPVYGSGFRVYGLRFMLQASGFRFRVQGLG
jgi:hypothetical protein